VRFLSRGKDYQPRDNISSLRSAGRESYYRTHGKLNDSVKSEDNLTEGVSFLANA
jgi:hypothetical protein